MSQTVEITLKASNQSKTFRLPVKIGRNANCNIFINNSALDNIVLTLDKNNEGSFYIKDQNGNNVSIDTLDKIGISVAEPAAVEPSKNSGLFNKISEVEQNLIRMIFKQEVPLFLAPKFMAIRLSLLLILMSIPAIINMNKQQNAELDFSKRAVKMVFNSINNLNLGFARNLEARREAVILNVALPENIENEKLFFSFEGAGLDKGSEIQVFVNKNQVYNYDVRSECHKRFCNIKMDVQPEFTIPGMNTIVIKHAFPTSDYHLRNFLLKYKPKATQENIIAIEYLYALAERYYNDRELAPENLKISHENISKAITMTKEIEFSKELQFKIRILLQKIKGEFKTITKSLNEEISMLLKLKKYDKAKYELKKLLRYYPESYWKKRNQIIETIKQVDILIKGK